MQFLAIVRRRTERFSEEEFAALLEPEAEFVRELYSEGVIRNIWSRGDRLGAVLLFEADSEEEVRRVASGFPLAQRDMLELEYVIPLRSYRGFAPRGR